MKSILVIALYMLAFSNSHAAFCTSEIPLTKNETWKNMKAVEFIKCSAQDFSKLSGKKLSLKERISFSVLKMEMKKQIKKKPTLTVTEFFSHKKKLGTGWIVLISVLGTLLLLMLVVAISGVGDTGF